MRKRSIIILLSLTILIALPVLSGCSSTSRGLFVGIRYEEYRPDLDPALRLYAGQRIYLMNVLNRAENTTVSTYFSTDEQATYGNPDSGPFGVGGRSLESYFWYSFQRALQSLEMRVSNWDNPDMSAAGVEFSALSITDGEFHWNVAVYDRGAPIWDKQYTISEPPLPAADVSEFNLRHRAYRMIDRTMNTVLSDPAFQAAFRKASH